MTANFHLSYILALSQIPTDEAHHQCVAVVIYTLITCHSKALSHGWMQLLGCVRIWRTFWAVSAASGHSRHLLTALIIISIVWSWRWCSGYTVTGFLSTQSFWCCRFTFLRSLMWLQEKLQVMSDFMVWLIVNYQTLFRQYFLFSRSKKLSSSPHHCNDMRNWCRPHHWTSDMSGLGYVSVKVCIIDVLIILIRCINVRFVVKSLLVHVNLNFLPTFSILFSLFSRRAS